MLAQWTGEVVGQMHVYGISHKSLAAKIGWHEKYLSQVMNGRVCPKNAEDKVKHALGQLIEQELNRDSNVNVNNEEGGGMVRRTRTQYEFTCKLRLLEMNMTQRELIDKVKQKTGLYVDTSVMSKLFRGLYVSPKIKEAVEEILGVTDDGGRTCTGYGAEE